MNNSTIFYIIVAALIISIVSPFLLIWSLNTLFGLNIAYGFFEWLAALILFSMATGNNARFKTNKE